MSGPIATGALRDALQRAQLLVDVRGHAPDTLSAIVDDSRQVIPGSAFVAVRGSAGDGHRYLGDATARGMAVAIVEDRDAAAGTPALVVRDSRGAAAVAGAVAFGFPARALRVIGVTGTSGKTTTVAMLRHVFDGGDGSAASIGTLGVLVGSEGRPLPGGQGLTTPGPIELQRVLRDLVGAGVRTVAMEASSHALEQRRVDGVAFAAGVFTNLSRDHLDYHGTMAAYLQAKARLVALLAPDGVAVVNADDGAWEALPPAPRVVRYGLAAANVDVAAREVRYGPDGSAWTLEAADGERASVALPLIGDFNVSNALAAAAAALALGVAPAVAARRLASLPQVPGRLERILERPVVLRDYAHKPDAMERALDAVRPFVGGRLIVVFGCGGDRDRGKRPIMGAIAERKADLVILTSDNPRTEDPERILDEIETGMARRDHLRVEDRREAIRQALAAARAGDVIVLAGKGHETYQIRGTASIPFDEREIVRELRSGVPAA